MLNYDLLGGSIGGIQAYNVSIFSIELQLIFTLRRCLIVINTMLQVAPIPISYNSQQYYRIALSCTSKRIRGRLIPGIKLQEFRSFFTRDRETNLRKEPLFIQYIRVVVKGDSRLPSRSSRIYERARLKVVLQSYSISQYRARYYFIQSILRENLERNIFIVIFKRVNRQDTDYQNIVVWFIRRQSFSGVSY